MDARVRVRARERTAWIRRRTHTRRTHDVHTTTCTHSVGDRRRVDTLTTFVARCVVPPAHVLVVLVVVVASIPGGACNVPRGMMLLRLLTAADGVMNDE